MSNKNHISGFTLIELSIVLVIIGLIAGGVLVGQDLIQSARIRATISQIEQYNTAVNTFKLKYGYLPGDIPDPYASQLGFPVLAYAPYHGDGLINYSTQSYAMSAEARVFWADLSIAGLIAGKYPALDIAQTQSGVPVSNFVPLTKLENKDYWSVTSGGVAGTNYNSVDVYGTYSNITGKNGKNYFTIMDGGYGGFYGSPITRTVAVIIAYNIDSKVDDGLPQTGKVISAGYNETMANCCNIFNWAVPQSIGASIIGTPQMAIQGSNNTCFDNNNSNGATQKYSISQDNGTNNKCNVSIEFQ